MAFSKLRANFQIIEKEGLCSSRESQFNHELPIVREALEIINVRMTTTVNLLLVANLPRIQRMNDDPPSVVEGTQCSSHPVQAIFATFGEGSGRGRMTFAAITPSTPPINVSQARAAKTDVEVSPLIANVTISVNA